MQHYYLASLRSQLDSWKAKVKFFTKVVDAKYSETDLMQWHTRMWKLSGVTHKMLSVESHKKYTIKYS